VNLNLQADSETNILLPASGRPAAKVSDFGIARLADIS